MYVCKYGCTIYDVCMYIRSIMYVCMYDVCVDVCTLIYLVFADKSVCTHYKTKLI
jgi:hypothetical protein